MVSKSIGIPLRSSGLMVRHQDEDNGNMSITQFFGDSGTTASSKWYGQNVLASEF
jgi:hypothetical protein